MFFKRRFLSLILALFLLAGLTSCGGPPEDAGSGPSASDLGQAHLWAQKAQQFSEK